MEERSERELRLQVGHYHWRAGFEREHLRLFLIGIAQTEVPNIIAVRGLSLGWRWPWLRSVNYFTDNPEYMGGGEA